MKFFMEESKTAASRHEERQHEGDFQRRRAVYLRLFPNDGEESLKRAGIPTSTLPK
jgi:hypothetical protein